MSNFSRNTASDDWQRVEACLIYGLRKWCVFLVGMLVVARYGWNAGVVPGLAGTVAVLLAQYRWQRWITPA